MELPLKREGIEGWESVAEREIPRTGTGRYKKSLQLIGCNDFFYGYAAGALFFFVVYGLSPYCLYGLSGCCRIYTCSMLSFPFAPGVNTRHF